MGMVPMVADEKAPDGSLLEGVTDAEGGHTAEEAPTAEPTGSGFYFYDPDGHDDPAPDPEPDYQHLSPS